MVIIFYCNCYIIFIVIVTGHSWKKDLIATDIVTDRVNVLVKEETEIEIKIEIEIDLDLENEGM